MDLSIVASKPFHELEIFMRGAIGLQLAGKDVAIPYLQGAPGGGKTSLIKYWCIKYGWQLVSRHYSLIPIEEISGLPQFVKMTILVDGIEKEVTGTEWSYPEILSKIIKELDPKKPIVLFLDDFHLCSPASLELGFEMFTERSIRGYKIPNNVAFALAGNTSSKAGSKAGNSAIANRCAAFPVHMDFTYWKNNFATPHGVNYKVISFLSNEKYKKYFHGEEQSNQQWPSPRSWTRFAEFLSPLEAAFNNNISFNDVLYLAAAHVGNEAASEFTSYYKLYLETEMDKIFDGTKAVNIPEDMTGQYIFCLAACGEFFNRYPAVAKDKNKLDDLMNIFCKIILKIAKKSLSIATIAGKEIVDANIQTLYGKFKNCMTSLDTDVSDKISKEILLIAKS